MFKGNGIRLACIAAMAWTGACAADLESGTGTDNNAIETPGTASSARETRVGIVFAIGSNSEDGLPPRPPSIIESLCIDLEDPDAEITGKELLAMAAEAAPALEVVVASYGGLDSALCKVEEYGCPAEDCFCDDTAYWSYWLKHAGTAVWDYAPVGMTTRKVHPGDMDGWSWLSLSSPIGNPGAALPALSFSDVCPPKQTVLLPVIIR